MNRRRPGFPISFYRIRFYGPNQLPHPSSLTKEQLQDITPAVLGSPEPHKFIFIHYEYAGRERSQKIIMHQYTRYENHNWNDQSDIDDLNLFRIAAFTRHSGFIISNPNSFCRYLTSDERAEWFPHLDRLAMWSETSVWDEESIQEEDAIEGTFEEAIESPNYDPFGFYETLIDEGDSVEETVEEVVHEAIKEVVEGEDEGEESDQSNDGQISDSDDPNDEGSIQQREPDDNLIDFSDEGWNSRWQSNSDTQLLIESFRMLDTATRL